MLGAAVHTFLLQPDLFDKSADIIYYICIFRVGECTEELEPKVGTDMIVVLVLRSIYSKTQLLFTVLMKVFDIRARKQALMIVLQCSTTVRGHLNTSFSVRSQFNIISYHLN